MSWRAVPKVVSRSHGPALGRQDLWMISWRRLAFDRVGTRFLSSVRTNHPAFGREFTATFEPGLVEKGVYKWWEQGGVFKTKDLKSVSSKDDVFSMVIPPPNVTGQLHIGHALTVTIQDSLIRWNKMKGKTVVWIPGVDHAGIATQTVVEKKLFKDERKTRHDLGREKFLEKVWDWYALYNGKIDNQLRRLGSSLDWERKVFTMDDQRYETVTNVFVELYRRDLIYRDLRLIHWCPFLRTVLSDLEIDYTELNGATQLRLPGRAKTVEFGVMHDFAYELADGEEGEIVVSTTRLETMLGDTGIAVHPDDPRYKHLQGKFAKHPFFPDRRLPIVADATLVDMEQGTGAVKLTPAHDENDFACGKRHALETINILNESGTLNENCGSEWNGMDRFDAREKLVEVLNEKGLYRGKRDNKMQLGRCSRSGDVIEPFLKPQWYVKCDGMGKRALDAVANGDLDIQPEMHKKIWAHFLGNIQDWCISRQLWWGHRIPAYKPIIDGEKRLNDEWIVESTEEKALESAKNRYPNAKKIELEQDPDVLDTWFSSSLFPLTALGWPQKLDCMNAYPLSLMETGTDILFFWVARMAMICSEIHSLPFKHVFLHPIVRDRDGKKMSKSLGNVIDPIHVIDGVTLKELEENVKNGNLDQAEVKRALSNLKRVFPDGIPACGTDALRLALASYLHNGVDGINMDIVRVVTWRHFCNKLWNATRYTLSKLETTGHGLELDPLETTLENEWILQRLDGCIRNCNEGFAKMDFPKVTGSIQDFFINDFCDVYLEASKYTLANEPQYVSSTLWTLRHCVESTLRLLHPIAPFVSEELWHRLMDLSHNDAKYEKNLSLCERKYPEVSLDSISTEESGMALLIECAHAIRSLKEKLVGVIDSVKLHESITLVDQENRAVLHQPRCVDLLQHLSRTRTVIVLTSHTADESANAKRQIQITQSIQNGLTALLRIEIEQNDLDRIESEVEKLEKKLMKTINAKDKIVSLITQPKYIEKAPEHVKEADQSRLSNTESEIVALETSLSTLKSLFEN